MRALARPVWMYEKHTVFFSPISLGSVDAGLGPSGLCVFGYVVFDLFPVNGECKAEPPLFAFVQSGLVQLASLVSSDD